MTCVPSCRLVSIFLFAAPCWAQCGAGTEGVKVTDIDTEHNKISMLCPGIGQKASTYSVTGDRVKPRLPHLQPGDQLTVWTKGDELQEIVLTQAHTDAAKRWLTLALAGGGWLLLGLLLSRFNVLQLIMGEDGRYSNSKFQAVVWFSVVIVFYGAFVVLRGLRLGVGLMSIGIPTNLLMLSGLSAFSFAAAKGITTAKVQDAQARGIAAPKGGSGSQGIIVDLTTNDSNRLDLGDFQMLVVTLIAVGYYFVLAFSKLGALDASNAMLPDVDTTILASFGLGQGAYLTKKAVGDVGNN